MGLRVFTSVFAPTAYGHYITAGHKLLYVVVAGALFRALGQAATMGAVFESGQEMRKSLGG